MHLGGGSLGRPSRHPDDPVPQSQHLRPDFPELCETILKFSDRPFLPRDAPSAKRGIAIACRLSVRL